MAFHQPTARQPLQRVVTQVGSDEGHFQTRISSIPQVGIEESQTWVLFSPADDATTTSYLSSVHESSQLTPGRSRVSDLGSFNTAARSDINSAPANSAVRSVLSNAPIQGGEESPDDDAELDVLDSHLPEFRSNLYTAQSQSIPVLPTHNGLGSFGFDTRGMEMDMQEHIYAFERYNPKRIKRRRESLERGQLELENDQMHEIDRNRRIEEWRQEQSQILLDAIKKETRKRRQSEASVPPHHHRTRTVTAEETGMLGTPAGDPTYDSHTAGTEWHEQDGGARDPEGQEGAWTWFTRKVIRDLLGIDDQLLAILFGEALPVEGEDLSVSLSSIPKAFSPSPISQAEESHAQSDHDSSWRLQMLERIARELGLLVHHMSTRHPGAFSAYARMQQLPLPYAGLPVIPEAEVAMADHEQSAAAAHQPLFPHPPPHATLFLEDSTAAMMPLFRPTVPRQHQHHHLHHHHYHRRDSLPGQSAARESSAMPSGLDATFTKQEWEQDLDIKLVFRYLRSRFTSAAPTSAPPTCQSSTARPSTLTLSQEAAARAARVRLHHPLVGRSAAAAVRRASAAGVTTSSSPALGAATTTSTTNTTHPTPTTTATAGGPSPSPAAAAAATHAVPHARQRSGSCASQSTRRSGAGVARRGSLSASSRHSSRHYWDIGGSVGTGSMIASTGPMGSWGEV